MSHTSKRLLVSLAALVVLVSPACTDEGGPSATGSTASTTTTQVEDGVVDEISLRDCPPGTDTAGVTSPTSSEPGVLRLVTSHPTDGAFAANAGISYGAQARFATENEQGGVDVAGEHYLVEVDARNDASDPLATKQNVTEEFDPDGSPAFAAFGLVGTDNVAAARERLTGWCVPDVFAVSPSPAASVSGVWSVGAPVVLETTEAAALVDHVKDIRPTARMGLLLPEGDRGDRIEAAFSRAVEGSAVTIAAVGRVPVGVDTDVRDRVTALSASGADVFVDAAELLSCPAAIEVAEELRWPSLVLAAGGCAARHLLARAGPSADGVLSAENLMDPSSDQWAANDRVTAYRVAIAGWADDHPDLTVDPDDSAVALGWTMGDLFVKALSMSSGATRSELMTALTALEASGVGLAYEGISFITGPGDRWLGEAARVARFDAESAVFEPVGAISSYEGGQAVPDDLRPAS